MRTTSVIMGERTVLTLNSKNKASLRTTIPMFAVKQWKLTAGDELEWSLEISKEGELILAARKVKSKTK
jgi:hypothetical protein